MIPGSIEKEIRAYIMIDHVNEGPCWVEAIEGTETESEKIIGIPLGWYGENSMPFIEHRLNGIVTKTVNVSDVSKIEFWIHIEPYDPAAEGHE